MPHVELAVGPEANLVGAAFLQGAEQPVMEWPLSAVSNQNAAHDCYLLRP